MPQLGVTQPPAPGGLPAALAASVRDAIAASRAPRTLRLYAGAFRRWAAWADANGFAPLPAAPVPVAGYLAHLGTYRSVATARQAAAAIAHAHRTAGHPNPCESEGVRRTLAGIARQHAAAGKAVRQAAAITGERLAAVRATIRTELRGASPSSRRRAARDSALLAVMRDGLLRRSEAAAIRWADLETVPDGSGRLTIRRSKTDQTGAGGGSLSGSSYGPGPRRDSSCGCGSWGPGVCSFRITDHPHHRGPAPPLPGLRGPQDTPFASGQHKTSPRKEQDSRSFRPPDAGAIPECRLDTFGSRLRAAALSRVISTSEPIGTHSTWHLTHRCRASAGNVKALPWSCPRPRRSSVIS